MGKFSLLESNVYAPQASLTEGVVVVVVVVVVAVELEVMTPPTRPP